MSMLTINFADEDEFKVFSALIQAARNELQEICSEAPDVLQGRLLFSICHSIYTDKIAPKLLKPPEKYQIQFNDSQATSLALIIRNYDFVQGRTEYNQTILNAINTLLDEYLTNTPIINKKRCVNLLNSGTYESNIFIGSSDKPN